MQYGNFPHEHFRPTVPPGLNRTMQYGNDVVPPLETNEEQGLNRTMQYGNLKNKKKYNNIIMFKSYYVVWKRRSPLKILFERECLNRTMQYGNLFFFRVLLFVPLQFKSYYVVWKLTLSLQNYYDVIKFKSYYVVWKHTFFLLVRYILLAV